MVQTASHLKVIGRQLSPSEHALIERVREVGFSGCNYLIDQWLENPDDSRSLFELLAQEWPTLFNFMQRLRELKHDLEQVAILDPDGVLDEGISSAFTR